MAKEIREEFSVVIGGRRIRIDGSNTQEPFLFTIGSGNTSTSTLKLIGEYLIHTANKIEADSDFKNS